MITNPIAAGLRLVREAEGLTQREVAAATDVHILTIQRYEAGVREVGDAWLTRVAPVLRAASALALLSRIVRLVEAAHGVAPAVAPAANEASTGVELPAEAVEAARGLASQIEIRGETHAIRVSGPR